MTPPHRASFLPRVVAVLAAAIALAGCNTLPHVTPHLVQADPADLRVQAANGRILSPERTKAILAGLQNGEKSDVLGRHLALEQAVSESPLTIGNRATLLEDGPATYRAMLAAIASARDHVHMETYIFDDDDVGYRFADALMAKAREGVSVALIHDGVGTLGTEKSFFERMNAAGVRTLRFNPVNPLKAKAGWDLNERDHRKLLIVDGKVAIMGGINISAVYSSGSSGSGSGIGGSAGGSAGGGSAGMPPGKQKPGAPGLPWRDTDLQLEGPVVAELQKLFLETWAKQKGPPLPGRNHFPSPVPAGKEVVRAIGSTPDEPFSLIYVTLVSAINAAESEVFITNAYFVPDPQLQGALVAAARRGVDVRVIVPSTSDSSLVFHAGRAKYERLLQGGVKLYERQSALLHAKTALIDGVWSTIGSTNLDWRSFLHNQEVTAVILGSDFGARMRAAFERDLAASTPITPEGWRRRPVSARIKETFSRLWEYWL